jgi:RNA polymerase sigma-70 factor (ECF subfamily)
LIVARVDSTSFEDDRRRLFNQYLATDFPKVYNYILRLTRSPETAEDIVQEAFLKAWNAFGRFDPDKPFFPWILQIARRQALDYFRSQKKLSWEDLPTDSLPSPGPTPEQAALDAETANQLEAALAQLPEPQRSAAYLYYKEELDLKTLAGVLKKSVHATTSLLHRSRENLRKTMTSLFPHSKT